MRHPGSPRHEMPEIDATALDAARAADRLLAVAREMGSERWVLYLAPLPDRLRDDAIGDLRRMARIARSAYGPKDSIREALPEDVTEPFLRAIDRLLKAIARHDLDRN